MEANHIEYADKEEAWHLFIDFEKGSTFACPNSEQQVKRMGAMRLMAEMPVNAAAHELREYDTRMWRIFHHYVDKAMSDVGTVTPSDSRPTAHHLRIL